jgi:hypothetical protein
MLKIIVVAKNEETCTAIVQAVQAEGASAVASSSLKDLPGILREVPTNGILLDIITSTKASAEEKQETNDLLQLYPHAKVKVTEDGIKIIGINKSLKQFVHDCQSFKARVIRACDRPIRYTGVYLSADNNFEDAEKAVTLNITDGGCFVYTAHEWKVDDRVWLHFKEDDRIRLGVVRWVQPWGNSRRMPGIGINFIQDPDTVLPA